MTTLDEWCNLCHCKAYKPFTHVHGKRHCKRLKQFNETFRRLNTSLKFKIVSFLFPRIVNFYTLHKEIHSVNMHRCINEMICFKFNVVTLCDTCCFPKETLSYDEFQHIYSTVSLCLNCAYTVLTTSTYLYTVIVPWNVCVKKCTISYTNITGSVELRTWCDRSNTFKTETIPTRLSLI